MAMNFRRHTDGGSIPDPLARQTGEDIPTHHRRIYDALKVLQASREAGTLGPTERDMLSRFQHSAAELMALYGKPLKKICDCNASELEALKEQARIAKVREGSFRLDPHFSKRGFKGGMQRRL